MKNNIYITTLIVLLLTSCEKKSNFDNFTARSFGLNGNIEKLSERRYPASFKNDSILEAEDIAGKIKIHKYFDTQNTLVKTETYDSKGELLSETIVKDNISSKYIGSKTYNINGILTIESSVVESTDTSLVIQDLNINQNSTSLSELIYNKNKLLINTRTHLNDTTFLEWTFFRNKKGEILYTRMIDKFGSMRDTAFLLAKYLEFDSVGNWTKRIDINKDKPDKIYVHERKIVYRVE